MLMSSVRPLGELEHASEFVARHIGPDAADEKLMLSAIGAQNPNFTRRALIDAIVPRSITRAAAMDPMPLVSGHDL